MKVFGGMAAVSYIVIFKVSLCVLSEHFGSCWGFFFLVFGVFVFREKD